ncbi:8-oxo-dGTP diphosphatase [Parafrankia irregularis]|uniref:8-oxo-dGTP diphosphatase n=1 Tax=Parafrankia irregularis TaxID=795642 RepID=A0A0S4QLA8_9ACTN|nr:8-oxo-dGTP diphosphatase [Parafrankia irregularis]
MVLRCLGASAQVPFAAVTSVSVVVVAGDGALVLADLARGWDLPGGHVQRGETGAEQTARREVWEEVRVRVGVLEPVEVIESDLFGADDLTYMLVFAARVAEFAEWSGGLESAGRVVVSAEEFLARYRGGDPVLMRHLVGRALAVLGMGIRPADSS